MADALAVCVLLKLPHWALPQMTVQLTPALLGSFVTVAARLILLPMSTKDGGVEVKVTAMGGGVMVMVVETNLKLSLAEVAVTVTVFPVGTAEGAV